MTFFDGYTIGERIARYRKLNGWTMDELVERTEGAIGKSVIANLETRRRQDITVAQLMALSEALGVPPVALLLPLERPFDRLQMMGGWNRSVLTLTHVFSGEVLWTPEEDATPAGLTAANLIVYAEQLDLFRSMIMQELSRLARDVSENQIRTVLERTLSAHSAVDEVTISAIVGDHAVPTAQSLSRNVRAYRTMAAQFSSIGGAGATEAPWVDWMRARGWDDGEHQAEA